MEQDELYLSHILDSIRKIKSYLNGKSFDDFMAGELLQSGVLRELEVIGEAGKRLSPQLKQAVDMPWVDISAMRNKIAHDYFEINYDIIWEAATVNILGLEKELQKFMKTNGTVLPDGLA